MMTAEQFWFDGHVCKQHKRGCCDECMQHVARADAHAAAQLAEKEQEIAQIKKELHRVYETNTVNADLYKAAYERAEAAEQRLQEAQADRDSHQRVAIKTLERLRQREAELEQRWIAVGERLPEEHGQYLVWVHGVGCDGDMVSVTTEARFDQFNWFMEGGWLSHEVQGWQPLPSPPKVQP